MSSLISRARVASVALVAIGGVSLAACTEQPEPTSPSVASAPALAKAVNDKFVFEGVTLTDSNGSVILNATIFAGSKNSGKSGGTTVCGYSTAGGLQYLGQFEAVGVFIDNTDALRTYCINNFANRQIR